MKADHTSLSWLAGLTDGEATFTIRIVFHRNLPHHLDIRPLIVWKLKAGDGCWTEKVVNILSSLGIGFHTHPSNERTGRYLAVTVSKKGDIEKLSALLLPYLTVKAENARNFSHLPRGKRVYSLGTKFLYLHRTTIDRWIEFIERTRALNGKYPRHVWTADSIRQFYLEMGASFIEDLIEKARPLKNRGATYAEIEAATGLDRNTIEKYLVVRKELAPAPQAC